MERKSFERGTVTGGIVRIVISVIAIIIATVILTRTIKNWDAEDTPGQIFMCVISGIMFIFSVAFIINGIQMIKNGGKSLKVTKKGHSERGRIIDLKITDVTENNNGAVTRYKVYTLKFEYTDDNGDLCESSENISQRIFDKLQEMKLVPILVLGERAVFDKKKFEDENFIMG